MPVLQPSYIVLVMMIAVTVTLSGLCVCTTDLLFIARSPCQLNDCCFIWHYQNKTNLAERPAVQLLVNSSIVRSLAVADCRHTQTMALKRDALNKQLTCIDIQSVFVSNRASSACVMLHLWLNALHRHRPFMFHVIVGQGVPLQSCHQWHH